MEIKSTNNNIYTTKKSIIRLARRAGVKNISEDSYAVIQEMINDMLSDIIHTTIAIKAGNNTKTIMAENVYKALDIEGHNVARSKDLSTSICT